MRIYNFLRNAIFSITAKKTIGVRILLIHEEKVLLVKHTYQPGWYTIGGGVDASETPRQAIERELKEEVGATLTAPPKLFSVYLARQGSRDDYVIFYIGHGCIQEPTTSSEIAEQQWFPIAQLPHDTTPATRRRIQEYLALKDINEIW